MNTLKPRRQHEAPIVTQWVPDRSIDPGRHEDRYKGPRKKPWEYQCEAVIPCLDSVDALPLIVSLLRLQTVRPYIVIIDTGSTPENFAKVEELRNDDVEVHSLRFGAVRHPSDFPAIAMDLAFAMCRTEFMFTTHADVFPRSRTLIERFMAKCNQHHPAVGYRMTERKHPDWERVVSHTASVFHMPTMDEIGAGWNLRRLCRLKGIEHAPNSMFENYPDTELLLSEILWKNGYEGVFMGDEVNKVPTIDENIYHCRSLTCAKLYAPAYAAQCQQWLETAKDEAMRNVLKWSGEQL